MRRKCSIVLTSLIVACSISACQSASAPSSKSVSENKESAVSETPETTASTEAEISDEEKKEKEQELYNSYIEVNNFMLGRLNDSLERYFNYVDIEQEEFTLLDADDDYFDCYSLSEYDIAEVENAYEIANSKSDKTTLDESFLKLYPSLSSVISTLNQIEVYTDMKSYLDDDYGKAKEYHTALMGSLAAYLTDGDTFMNELDVVATERQSEDLAEMKAEGYEVLYTMNMVLNLAGEIEDELAEQEVWDDNILDMDLDKIQPLYDEFVTNVDAMLAFTDEQAAEEGVPVNSAYWSGFIRDLKDTKVSLTEVLQKVKNGEELSYSDTIITGIAGNCSLSSFDAGYSSLINDYNNMVSY